MAYGAEVGSDCLFGLVRVIWNYSDVARRMDILYNDKADRQRNTPSVLILAFVYSVKMSFQTPTSKCRATIPGLGTLDGLQYSNGVQQFCGTPYAHLPKRWTRSILKTSWYKGHHDGTKLGYVLLNTVERICPSHYV